MPEPFDGDRQHIPISRLHKSDAVELVKNAMTVKGLRPDEGRKGETQPEIEALVEAVKCHARSLVLLAPYVSQFGVENTTESVSKIMAELHKKHPDEREQSLYASVELSLQRLSSEAREMIKPLGVFQGGASLIVMAMVLELEPPQVQQIAAALVETGLAEPMPYGFLRFDPALSPYLRSQIGDKELPEIEARWAESVRQLSGFLYKQQFQDAQLSATLTALELPNLMRTMEYTHAQNQPEATVNLATSLEQLLSSLGRKQLLQGVSAIRQSEESKLGNWGRARFRSRISQVERLLEIGNLPQARLEAEALLQKCLDEGEGGHGGARYDTATVYFTLGRVLKLGGSAEAALEKIEVAHERFQELGKQGDRDAESMASACLTEKADCLRDLGRLEEAATAYEEGTEMSRKLGNIRSVAVKKGQLGTVRMLRKQYNEAIEAYEEARGIFEKLGEPRSVSAIWHQIGMVYERAERNDEAEKAYKQSLAIEVQQKNTQGEADSLHQLGILYDNMGRFEDSVKLSRQAVDKYVELENKAAEGRARNNLAITLEKLKRYDEARTEIKRAIECKSQYGHAVRPWTSYVILSDIETATGNYRAAREARQKAIELYFAYRRDGGETQRPGGRICAMVSHAVKEGEETQAMGMLTTLSADARTPDYLKVLIPKFQQILDGNRDRSLADDPELYYRDSAELLLLLEQLAEMESTG